VAAALVVAVVTGVADGDDPPASAALKVDRFDRDRAFADLRYQVELGPRPAGSETSKQLAEWLRERLPNGRIQSVPGGLQNVIGSLPGRGKPIVVAAHYDTKDIPHFVGANDGAGGTAAVLEIARAITRWPADNPPIRFVLFDGEESPDDSKDFYTTGLRGSKYYARRFAKRTRAVILLDFVAEKGGMRIPREDSSSIELWGRLRAAARKVGAQSAFPDETSGAVLDDHTPFLRRGVPAIDLIDFTFKCWHKTCDDMSAVSARALDLSGETVVQLLLDLSR
jgi:glutaminyl-peptide cyclotransferase